MRRYKLMLPVLVAAGLVLLVVPLGLLTGAKLLCDVPVDASITYDMVDLVDTTTLYHLRTMQDAGAAGALGQRNGARDRPAEHPSRVAAE